MSGAARLGWRLHRQYGYERGPDLVTDAYRIWFVSRHVARTVGVNYQPKRKNP